MILTHAIYGTALFTLLLALFRLAFVRADNGNTGQLVRHGAAGKWPREKRPGEERGLAVGS